MLCCAVDNLQRINKTELVECVKASCSVVFFAGLDMMMCLCVPMQFLTGWCVPLDDESMQSEWVMLELQV